MSVRIQVKRGTRANLDALAGANGLHQGELYWVTDESKFAVGVGVSTYVDIGPGSGGGATDLGQVLTGTTVEITSSTGANTVLPAATPGGDAGILTGLDAQKIVDAITSANLGATPAATTVTVDCDVGTNAVLPDAIASGNAGVLSGARAQRVDDAVQSGDVTDIIALTQTAYDALTPDTNTLYLITGP